MSVTISKDSLANRRLYMCHSRTLLDFADKDILSLVTIGQGVDMLSTQPLPPDIVSVGTHALRLTAQKHADTGTYCHRLEAACRFMSTENLTATPTVFFALSLYDGEHDSQYFKNVSENMYFVERPDPLLVSHAYLAVTLMGKTGTCTRTVQLTNYGFNKVFANFSGEAILDAVEGLHFEIIIDETAPGWQGVAKLDTIMAGMAVDFTLRGSGMETLFSATGGKIVHRDGVLTFSPSPDSTEPPSITLPLLDKARDTVCDVFLPIKNTLVLRLLSEESTLGLTVRFRTDAEKDSIGEKHFELSGLQDFQTVYLNLSDCPEAVGHLCELTLLPDTPCSLSICKIAFEQEKKLEASAGDFVRCTADVDSDTVTFACRVLPAYVGHRVEIYELFPDVIHPSPEQLTCIASGMADSENFCLTAPLYKAQTTRIASQFWGVVRTDGDAWIAFGERTVISNWRDMCTPNPYAFELPPLLYDVTDPRFGARGDGYTDDTDAIQAALDAARDAGGGKVILPDDHAGDYGRRYIVTNLRLHSGVELHIAQNAVLWQSDDLSHYKVMPRFGHNVAMTGVNWPANHTSGNMPLLYAFRESHFRLTGPGTIRMCDTESHSEDGYFRFIGDNVCIGCVDRLHVTPVGCIECDHFEISDIRIIRSSAVYLNLQRSHSAYIGNVFMDESKCTGADGMWPSGSDGVIFTRIMLNNNDDGICLSSGYNDPRDMLWSFTHPGTDCGTHRIELSHSRFSCYTFTASAISFCTWGTNSPELAKQEVSDIHIFDTVLEGRKAIGGWTDNPYYGVTPFDGSETDDFSPVKNVCIHNCEFRSPVCIAPLRITNCENDFGFESPSQFEYGNFLRRPAERNPYWTAGLSNWSYDQPATVAQVLLEGRACACMTPARGKACNLYQGLFLKAGRYTLEFQYRAGGRFTAFVRRPMRLSDAGCFDSQLKERYDTLASADFDELPGGYLPNHDWKRGLLPFEVTSDGLYQLGLTTNAEETIAVYATDFSIQAASAESV